MTKPRLVKVRALFYVLQQIQKEAAPILTQPPSVRSRFLACYAMTENYLEFDFLSVDYIQPFIEFLNIFDCGIFHNQDTLEVEYVDIIRIPENVIQS